MLEQLRAIFDQWHRIKEVQALTDRDIADLGISRGQLEHLMRLSADVPDRMAQMAAVFGLSPEQVERHHATYLDLLETCDRCGRKGDCRRALARGDLQPGQVDFCPNAPSYVEMARHQAV